MKEYLSQKGVSYEEHNVAEDRDAAREMIVKTQQKGVPVIAIGDNYVVGFNQSEIDRLLA